MSSLSVLLSWRQRLRTEKRVLVVTNGCFDLIHAGHVTYLESARSQGDALLVGLNSDRSVRELKGPDRPINPEWDRARVLCGLSCVDAVGLFDETRATSFLESVQPDIYVKGGDYTIATLDPNERHAVESCGGKIVILPVLEGRSTTRVVERMRRSGQG